MIALVYGGSGSGKSEYAESIVTGCSDPEHRFYVATMQVYGEEGHKRVERHRNLRAGKGFQTIECPTEIAQALDSIPDPSHATVLLECMSNLVANEMFDSQEGETELVSRIFSGIRKIAAAVEHLIFVSVNIFDDGIEYEAETQRYMAYLGEINQKIAALSDQVIEVVAGIPLTIK